MKLPIFFYSFPIERLPLLVALLFFCPNLLAASFSKIENRFFGYTEILIEGEIEKGDFEKFIDIVLVAGGLTRGVYIASYGGDAIESMRIGKLIRALKFSTSVPVNGSKPLCWSYNLSDDSNCTCQSSCVLIYLSGIWRTGTYLGVHRTFVDREYLKNLTLEEASAVSRKVSQMVRKYQIEMGAPTSLIDKIESVSSDNIELLSWDYIRKNLSKYEKNTYEWLIAKCGSKVSANEATMLEGREGEEAQAKFDSITKCENEAIVNERMKSFYSVIKAAIDESDKSLIPRRSLLKDLESQFPFKFSDLLGKSNHIAMDLLTLVGGGTPYSDSEVNDLIAKTIFFPFWVITFDQTGNVSRVTIDIDGFKISEKIELLPYQGYFAEGLDVNSSPEKFMKTYGTPIEQECPLSGGCEYRFKIPNAYIEVRFDSKKELESISWNQGQYF